MVFLVKECVNAFVGNKQEHIVHCTAFRIDIGSLGHFLNTVADIF